MFAAIDSWLFLLLVAVAALFRLLAKAAGSKPSTTQDESTFPNPELPQQPARTVSSDEEQIRKFLEALGQPRTADVPPPVPPRTDIPPRPVAPVQPPRSLVPVPRTETVPQSAKRRGVPKPAAESRRRFEPSRQPPPVPAAKIEVYEATTSPEQSDYIATRVGEAADQPVQTEERQNASVVRLLQIPGGLRQAIILREIFGAPRGLQPVEDLPGTA